MRGEWSSRGAGPHEASRLGKASRKLDFWIRPADRFVSSSKPRGCMLATLSNVLREKGGRWILERVAPNALLLLVDDL